MGRDLILLILALMTWGVGEGMFFYFQPIYLEQLGADPELIGIILGAYGVAMMVAHVPAGYLADRLGRKPLLLSAWFLGAVSAWVMALAGVLWLFVVGLLLYGTTLFVLAPLNAYVTVARGKLRVERAITLVSASFNLGAVVGPWIGGRIGDQVGLQRTYLLAACLFVLSMGILLFVRSQPVDAPAIQRSNRDLFRNRKFVGFNAVVFVAMFAMYLPQPLVPNFLQNIRGLSLEQIGTLFSISGIGVVVLNLVLGQVSANAGFFLSQAAVGIFSLAIWQGSGFPAYALGFFLLGGYKSSRSLASAQVSTLVRKTQLGLAYGLTETVGAATTVLAPPLAGALFTHQPELIFLIAISFSILALFVTWAYFRRITVGMLEGPLEQIL
jgi:predicted MFS family arabinose efflux permease